MSASAESAARYTRLAARLHWVVAGLIIINIAIANLADFLPDPQQNVMWNVHKSVGLTVLGLAVMRLLWRFAHRPPALPSGISKLERIASQISHGALYAVMLAMPISGYLEESTYKDTIASGLYYFGLVRVPLATAIDVSHNDALGDLHSLLGSILYLLFAVHVAAALKHQFLDKQKLLQRIAMN